MKATGEERQGGRWEEPAEREARRGAWWMVDAGKGGVWREEEGREEGKVKGDEE